MSVTVKNKAGLASDMSQAPVDVSETSASPSWNLHTPTI